MSRENVEVVRALFEAWNVGDMDAYRELLDPGVVTRPPRDWPEPGPFVGREAVMAEFLRMRDAWDIDSAEPISDFIDAAGRVVVRLDFRGKGHGPEVNVEMSCIYKVKNGKNVGQEFFWDHAEALETLGLSKQDADTEFS